jgi:hypothetical protein
LASRAVNQKVLPTPGVLSAPASPPIMRAIFRVIAKPRPVPPYLRAIELSACSKLLNKRDMASGAMPIPVSETSKRNNASSLFSSRPDTHRHTALGREFDRIAQIIEQGLAQARGITHQIPRQGCNSLSSLSFFSLRPVFQHGEQIADHIRRPEPAFLQIEFARLDLGKVENGIDDAQADARRQP